MDRKVWINKAATFDEAERFDKEYYLRQTSAERIEMVQTLREEHFKLKGIPICEDGKRLRRFSTIIKQA